MVRILSYNASQIREISRAEFEPAWAAPAGRFWIDAPAPAADELAWLGAALQLMPAHVAAVAEGRPVGSLLQLPRYLFGASTLVGLQDGRVAALPLFFFLGSRFLLTVHNGSSALLQTAWTAYGQETEPWRFGVDHLLGTLIDGMTRSYVNTAQVLDQTLTPLRQKGTWMVRRRYVHAATQTALQYGELRLQAERQASVLAALAACDHEALDANVRVALTQPAEQVAAVAAAARTGHDAARLLREKGAAAVATQRHSLQLLLLAGILTLLLLQLLGVGG